MRKFERGEREYKHGELVFVVTPDDHDVKIGIIDGYAGHGYYYVDYVGLKDCRLVDGIPIDEVDLSKVYKLPKSWTYYTVLFHVTYSPDHKRITEGLLNATDDEIRYAYEVGDLVKLKDRFNGHIDTEIDKKTYTLKRVHGDRRVTDKIHSEHIFFSSTMAKICAKTLKETIDQQKRLLANLTDEEYSWYEIERVFERAKLNTEEKVKIRSKIATMEELKPIEDLEARIFDGKIQFLTKDDKWADVFTLAVEEKPQPTEKYHVHVTLAYDLDEPIIYEGYTNEDPADIHKKYGNFHNYRLTIGCKEWCKEKALEIPAYYEGGVKRSETGALVPALIAHYYTKNGGIVTVDGRLSYCDLSFGMKYKIAGKKIIVFGNTVKGDEEIIELVAKKVRQEMGEWGDKIAKFIRDCPVEKR